MAVVKGSMFTRPPKQRVRGQPNGSRMTVAVGFSPGQFEVLSKMAAEAGLSFAEQIRQIVDEVIKLRVAPEQESADDRLLSSETESSCRAWFEDLDVCFRVVRNLRETGRHDPGRR